MKSLLIITALVSFLSVSSGALTSDRMSLYKGMSTSSEIADEVHGDYVEKDLMDFYIEPIVPIEKEKHPNPLLFAGSRDKNSESPTEYINVFSVKVPTKI